MNYLLLYHPLVGEDAAGVNKDVRARLGKALQERLTTHPESYGKPLRGNLAGYWSLRVGDFRIIYKVVKREVWVFGMINRRDVYEDVVGRLSWQP